MSLRQTLAALPHRLMGLPFVYDHVRPLAVGGIDFSPLYDQLRDPEAKILDIGCGTGAAHRYLGGFASYVGMDTDPVAVAHAQRRYGSAKATFHAQICTPADVRRVAPTDVVLAGILHHLDDQAAIDLLSSLKLSPQLRQVLTVDIIYLARRPLNNLLAKLDRGQFCRNEAQYLELVRESGLSLRRSRVLRSHPRTGLVQYLYIELVP